MVARDAEIRSGKEKGAHTLSARFVTYALMRCFASNISMLGAMSMNRHYLPPYKWGKWSTEKLSNFLLKIPWANLGKTSIWTSLFLISKPMSVAPVRVWGLTLPPLSIPVLHPCSGWESRKCRRQLSPQDPGNPSHNLSNSWRTHFFSEGQRQSAALKKFCYNPPPTYKHQLLSLSRSNVKWQWMVNKVIKSF